jgi:hypothetical protein
VFEVMMDGGFLLQGFSNQDLRQRLYPRPTSDPKQQKQFSGRTTRYLRLLRTHGLIHKLSHTRRYRVSPAGQQIMATALSIRAMDTQKLAA